MGRPGEGRGNASPAVDDEPEAGELSKLIRELRLHQLELEAQNEELQAAQAQLEQSRARYVSLYDFAPIAYFTVDLGTTIHEVNLTAAALLGMERARIVGCPLSRFVSPEQQAALRARIAHCIRTGAADPLATSFQVPGRAPLEVQLQMSACDDPVQGRPVCRLAASDVSELRQAQQRMHHSERMAALGRVTAALAHQINNPLAFVLANLELAERGGPVAPAALLEARLGIATIRDVITSLREFAHPGGGERVPTDPGAALQTALKLAAHEIQHRARVELALEAVPVVSADASHLAHVFLNLLLNAAQAIPLGAADQHTITVRMRSGPDRTVLVEISDTGRGMSKEVLGQIFEPFYTTKQVGDGMGLGLSIAYSTVRLLGGDITASSTEGRGSTFVVTLPQSRWREEPQSKGPPKPAAVIRPRRCRILVIDDQPNYGRTLKSLLEPTHEVVVRGSATEGLAMLRQGEPFDVILCDLMMPVMTGKDLYDRVLELSPALAARIVFMTGGAFGDTMKQFLEDVSSVCLLKPFPIEELERTVEQIVNAVPREA